MIAIKPPKYVAPRSRLGREAVAHRNATLPKNAKQLGLLGLRVTPLHQHPRLKFLIFLHHLFKWSSPGSQGGGCSPPPSVVTATIDAADLLVTRFSPLRLNEFISFFFGLFGYV